MHHTTYGPGSLVFISEKSLRCEGQPVHCLPGLDCAYSSPLLPFGETVLFKIPVSKSRRAHHRNVIPKGDTTWRKGIFVGRSVTSNEYLLGTEEGTISARSVRRFADSSKRYDRELMANVIGVPWGQGTTIGRPKRKADALARATARGE